MVGVVPEGPRGIGPSSPTQLEKNLINDLKYAHEYVQCTRTCAPDVFINL